MGKSKKIRLAIYLVVVAVVLALVYFHQSSPKEKQILITFSDTVNQNLPMMVDEMTRLDKVTPSVGNILNYQYTIMGQKAADLNKEAIRAAITPILIQDYKNDPGIKELRDLKTTIIYRYFDEEGILVCEVKVDPKEFQPPAAPQDK